MVKEWSHTAALQGMLYYDLEKKKKSLWLKLRSKRCDEL
jgi:hypothetical protein